MDNDSLCKQLFSFFKKNQQQNKQKTLFEISAAFQTSVLHGSMACPTVTLLPWHNSQVISGHSIIQFIVLSLSLMKNMLFLHLVCYYINYDYYYYYYYYYTSDDLHGVICFLRVGGSVQCDPPEVERQDWENPKILFLLYTAAFSLGGSIHVIECF